MRGFDREVTFIMQGQRRQLRWSSKVASDRGNQDLSCGARARVITGSESSKPVHCNVIDHNGRARREQDAA